MEPARVRRRVAALGLQGVPRHDPGRRSSSAIGTPSGTSYTDTTAANGTTYYYKVTAVNSVGEGPASNEASATPLRRSAREPASRSISSIVQTRTRSRILPAGRTASSVARPESSGSHRHREHARLLEVDDLHRLAQHHASTDPTSRSWARISTLPGTGNASGSTRVCSRPGTRPRRLHAADEPARRDDAGLPRARSTTAPSSRPLTVNQELRPATSSCCGRRARHRGLAQRRLGRGRDSALRTDSTYAATGAAGIGLRGTTGRLDDFGARTMGVAPATAPSAPQSLQATAGNAQVSLELDCSLLERRLGHHRLPRVPGNRSQPDRRP